MSYSRHSPKHGDVLPFVWEWHLLPVEIIGILSKIKYPYNVNQLTQQQAISMLHKHYEIERWVKTLKEERDYLEEEFEKLTLYH